jgi:hypothetical protein
MLTWHVQDPGFNSAALPKINEPEKEGLIKNVFVMEEQRTEFRVLPSYLTGRSFPVL